jgi:protein arginine kinase
MELNRDVPWNDANNDAPHGDVVLSCRARLARNIAGFPFVNRATEGQCREIVNITRQVLLASDLAEGMMWVDLKDASERDRQLLFERHLISKNHAENDLFRAVAISNDEALSVMVNEEDHIRMQWLAPGLRLVDVFQNINLVDDMIEQRLDYAFSPRWGYLTACPTNIGTGIRFSVMMHLPALRITNELERVRRASRDLHLAVRGYYGEGSDSAGDFYQISNQVTLGRGEEELLKEFEEAILPQIIEYERHARGVLVERRPALLEDRMHRALGVLRTARLLGTDEAMKLLSRARLGLVLERIDGIDLDVINRLFLQIQPAHLMMEAGEPLEGDQIRHARAELVRSALGV